MLRAIDCLLNEYLRKESESTVLATIYSFEYKRGQQERLLINKASLAGLFDRKSQ